MDEIKKCSECGSALAADGECPDCGAPEREPDWLDDYGFRKDEAPTATNGNAASEASLGEHEAGACRLLPFPTHKSRPMTAAELYDRADGHPEVTPHRARELTEIIEAVSKARGEARSPRLEWLKRIAEAGPERSKGADLPPRRARPEEKDEE